VNASPSHHFNHRYKDLQEEDETTSKICGRQLFSNFLACKSNKDFEKDGQDMSCIPHQPDTTDEDGKHFQSSRSLTKFSSGSSSTFDKDLLKFFDKDQSSPHRDLHKRPSETDTADSLGDENKSNRGGFKSVDYLFYQWNMEIENDGHRHAVDAKDRHKIFFDAQDASKNCRNGLPVDDNGMIFNQSSTLAMGNERNVNQGHKEGRDWMEGWTYSSDEEDHSIDKNSHTVIEILRQECNMYRGEAMALREEIDSIKRELGSLRQQMSGLAFHSDSVCV
jgi:hypothetical protein